MANPKLVYWDSSVFIAFLKNETGRGDTCRDIVNAAEDGTVRIVTSAFTLVEVIKRPNNSPLEIVPRFVENEVAAPEPLW